MKVIVIGAGAWGLPSALQLAARGHEVVLIDRDRPGGETTSSRGTSRLWRLADPKARRLPALRAGVEAMERLSADVGEVLVDRSGLLWRDAPSLPATAEILAWIGAEHDLVPAEDVGSVLPGLEPDGRDAIFVHDAGVVFADVLLERTLAAYVGRGGAFLPSTTVRGIQESSDGVLVELADGDLLSADHVVVAAGAGARSLLAQVGLHVPLRTYLEQTVRFEGDAFAGRPCLFDGPLGARPGVYAMPDPAGGYKLGIDRPLRPLGDEDGDRTPQAARTGEITATARSLFPSDAWEPAEAVVCSWTDSPDGEFLIDRPKERVTIACGDSGEGFKYAALVGEHIAALVEGGARPELVALWGLAGRPRLTDPGTSPREPTAMGR